MRSLQDLLSIVEPGDRVFLRGDLNVPLENGVITDTNRIDALLPTLLDLLGADCVVTVGTHLGRPQGTDPALSTEPIAEYLRSQIDFPVHFVSEFPPGKIDQSPLSAQNHGSVVLLNNLRFDPGEKKNQVEFAQKLVEGCQYYVNDAFGCCHRAHASVSAITRLKPSFVGYLIQKEMKVLTEMRDQPERPFWVVSGGAKVVDKIGVLSQLAPKLDGIVCAGGLANTLIHGKGIDVGASTVEPEALSTVQKLLSGAIEIVVPDDFIAGDRPVDPTDTMLINYGDPVPDDFSLFDIGPQTVDKIQHRLSAAKTIFWNGPAGVFESPEFSSGTRDLARLLARHEARVVVGGGDSAAAVRQMGLADHFHHVSTGGGAALEYLEGKTLPGIAALADSQIDDSEHD